MEEREMNGHTQQFEWALQRLREEFGSEQVEVEVGDEGRQVAALVHPGEGEERGPYRVMLKDPVLGDVNRISDPAAFVDAEVGHARQWVRGESKQRRTFG